MGPFSLAIGNFFSLDFRSAMLAYCCMDTYILGSLNMLPKSFKLKFRSMGNSMSTCPCMCNSEMKCGGEGDPGQTERKEVRSAVKVNQNKNKNFKCQTSHLGISSSNPSGTYHRYQTIRREVASLEIPSFRQLISASGPHQITFER